MRTGERNVLLTIQRKSVARDPVYKAEVVTWVTHAAMWSKLYDAGAAEFIAGMSAVRVGMRTTAVEMLYVADVTSDMRLLLPDGRLLQINGILETPPRKQLTLWCTEYTA